MIRRLFLSFFILVASFPVQAVIGTRGSTQNASAAGGAAANITFVNAGTVATANSGNVTPGLPAGTAVNDILIAIIESRDNVAHGMTGWTSINTGTSGSDHRASLFWRRATGTDPTTVTHTGGSGIGARIIGFRGVVATGSPFDTTNSFTVSGSDSTIEAAAINTVTANTMLVFTAHAQNDFNSIGTPAGSAPWAQAFFTEYNATGGGNDLAIGAYYGLRAGTGAQAAVQALATGGSAVSHGAQLALRPASTVASFSINVPVGTVTGDVMIAGISVRPCSTTSGGACTATITSPAAWILINTIDQTTGGGFGNRLYVYRRNAVSPEPAAYNWIIAGTPAHDGAAGGIITFTGVDTSNPIVAQAGQATASSSNHTAPSINTGAVTNTMLVTTHAATSAGSWTTPGGMVERVDIPSLAVPNDGGISMEMNTETVAAAGATGTRIATMANPPAADSGTTHALALRPLQYRMHVVLPGQTFTNGVGVSGTPTDQTPDTAFNLVQLVVTDTTNTIVTGYSGARTINYTGPGGSPVYTTAVNFTSGVATTTLATTLDTLETTTITANDGGDPVMTGITSAALNVVGRMHVVLPGQTFTAGVGVTGTPTDQTVNTAFNLVQLVVTNTSNNIVTSYNGARTIGYSGPSGAPSYTTAVSFTNGISTTTLATTLDTAETTTITATDAGNTNITGVPSASLNVTAVSGSTCSFSSGLISGLPGEYFSNMTLTAPSAGNRVDGPVDFNWAGGTPGVGGIGADNFSVSWEGVIRVTATDTYRFQTVSDDGVRLYVNNVLVIDNWTDHAATTDTSANVALTAGQVYDIRLEFYENGGQAEIRLRWGRASGGYSYSAIPSGPSPAFGEGLYYCLNVPVTLYLEVDRVILNDTTTTPSFTSVAFRQTYPTIPLVFALPTNEGTDPAALRIRNVTTTGFQIAQVEPEAQDGTRVAMTVDYIVITPGEHTLPDGRTVEAGIHATQSIQHGNGVPGLEGWDTVNFTTPFASTPSVLLQIQGLANESSNPPATTSIPWLTPSIQNVGTTSFETALERSEVNDGGAISTDETIAYLAIQGNVQGNFVAEGKTILYESINSADNIQGWDDENCAGNAGQSVSFVNTYTTIPLAVAHTSRHDGGDGGWIRRCNINTTQIFLAYGEDQFNDAEQNHTAEAASVLVFSEAFCYPDCVAVVVHHYAVSHPGTGVTCLPAAVTITAHDIGHGAVDPGAVTITLSTTTGKGDWTTVATGTGMLDNGTPGDGMATYDFPGGETAVTLALNYTDTGGGNAETFNINVDDGSATDARDNADPEDLDLTFSSTAFRFFNVSDGTAIIPTQLSGKSSDTGFNTRTLALQAIRASDTDPTVCTAAFPDSSMPVIGLGAECRDPASCAGAQVSIVNNSSTTVINTNADNGANGTTSYTPTTLLFTDSGSGFTHALFSLAYPDAGMMQLHAQYQIPLDDGTPSGDFMAGASNDFVVRPFGFDVQVTGNAGATGPGGGVFITAGTSFMATVTAVQWSNGEDGDNDGVPDGHDDTDPGNNVDLSDNAPALNYGQEALASEADISLTGLLDQPSGGNDPGLAGGTSVSVFSMGSGNTATARYDEVGIVELTANVADSDYLGAGAITGKSGYVGRFKPDHFVLLPGTVTNRSASSCAPASTFTYMDELFDIGFTLRAVNAQPSPAITQNYTGTFAKLPATTAPMNFGAVDLVVPTPLSGRLNVVSMAGAWNNGELAASSGMGISRAVGEDGPYDQLNVGIVPTDSDGVTMGSLDLDVDGAGGNDQAGLGTTVIRYGRLYIGTGVGSELLPVTVPFETQHFNGTAFVLNSDDSCTRIDDVAGDGAPDLSLSNNIEGSAQTDGDILICPSASTTITLGMGNNGVVVAGKGDLSFSAPGAGCVGYTSISVDLGTVSPPGQNQPWLQYDWNGDGLYEDNPSGRVDFGIYKGSENIIYTREPWD